MAKAAIKEASGEVKTRRMAHTAVVEALDIEVVNGQVVVALNGAEADAETVYVYEAGNVVMPKEAGLEIKPGEKVYWNAAGGIITKTGTDTLCGRCHEYSDPDDADVKVELENGAGL